jgi:hypothetical protein
MNKINFSFIELLFILLTCYLVQANNQINDETKGIIKMRQN